MEQYIILSIAGSDSSAGAGIQADIKSAAACGAYCATAITAITAQNTQGVEGIEVLSNTIFRQQIDAVMNDLDVKAIKLGMIPSLDMVKYIAEVIVKHNIKNVVLDPVMISTSGSMLVSEEVADAIIEYLLPLASLITPNIMECEFISGKKIESVDDFNSAADRLKSMGCKALLLKSGHLTTGDISDYLYNFSEASVRVYYNERIESRNTHGTGCSLSSAIASFLARGYALDVAVAKAEHFVHRAIESANYKMGEGYGPMNHLYNLKDDFTDIK